MNEVYGFNRWSPTLLHGTEDEHEETKLYHLHENRHLIIHWIWKTNWLHRVGARESRGNKSDLKYSWCCLLNWISSEWTISAVMFGVFQETSGLHVPMYHSHMSWRRDERQESFFKIKTLITNRTEVSFFLFSIFFEVQTVDQTSKKKHGQNSSRSHLVTLTDS